MSVHEEFLPVRLEPVPPLPELTDEQLKFWLSLTWDHFTNCKRFMTCELCKNFFVFLIGMNIEPPP